MKTIDELKIYKGNGKRIFLNPCNGRWVRVKEEKYQNVISDENEKKSFHKLLNEKYELFDDIDQMSNIRSIYFSITGKCNMRCKFCTMNSGPDVSTEHDLSLEEIEHIVIPKIQMLHPKRVLISGGEPLVRSDLIDILRIFHDSLPKTYITLQTNGLLLSCDFIRKAALYIKVLEISIENIFDNEERRAQMEKYFECAKENNVLLSLSFVVDSNSRKYLSAAIDICDKYKADFTMRIISLVGRAVEENRNDDVLNLRETIKIHKEVIAHLLKNQYFDERLTKTYAGILQPKRNCGAFGKMMAIHPDGTIYMCANFKTAEYALGNIHEKKMEDLKKDLNRKMQNPDYQKKFHVDKRKYCDQCEVNYFCSGPCRAECADNNEDESVVYRQCELMKIMLKYAMFYYERGESTKENLQNLLKYLEDVCD